jgi:mRNA interferase MazF
LILIATESDITISFITTQFKWQEEFDVKIEPSSTNGLKRTSLIRLSKLATIDKNLVIGKLGNLLPEELIMGISKNLKMNFTAEIHVENTRKERREINFFNPLRLSAPSLRSLRFKYLVFRDALIVNQNLLKLFRLHQ